MIFWLEIIGTAAFAISGAVVGIRKQMDLFGIMIMGAVTAVGGGVLRDIILGNTPPVAFRDPVYFAVALIAALTVFIAVSRRADTDGGAIPGWIRRCYEGLFFFADTVGLAVFTMSGMQVAQASGYGANIFLLLFVGVVTGVGGGVLRDILGGRKPQIFMRQFYAMASLLGAISYVCLTYVADTTLSYTVGLGIVIILRMLAVRFSWRLPKIHEAEAVSKNQ